MHLIDLNHPSGIWNSNRNKMDLPSNGYEIQVKNVKIHNVTFRSTVVWKFSWSSHSSCFEHDVFERATLMWYDDR